MALRRKHLVPAGILLAILSIPALGAGQSCPEGQEDILSRFARSLDEEVRADGIGGVTAGLAVGGNLVWAQGFGWADLDRGIPAGLNTIYRVGSISKSFTGVVLLQLLEKGVVQLDAPVVAVLPELAWLPSPPDASPPISFRQLASHTAGLAKEPDLVDAAAGPLQEWEAKILASIPVTAFVVRPGQEHAYSNIGFGILGYALSRAVGVPFMQLVAGSILRPLGMSASGFVVTPELAEYLAVGYGNENGGPVDRATPAREHQGRGYKVPNGGVYSTVGDLARFMAGISGHASAQILGIEGRRLLGVQQTRVDPTQAYGLGFRIWEGPGGARLLGHTGSVAGYTAFMALEPESGIGVILLRNYNQGSTDLASAGLGLLRAILACGDL